MLSGEKLKVAKGYIDRDPQIVSDLENEYIRASSFARSKQRKIVGGGLLVGFAVVLMLSSIAFYQQRTASKLSEERTRITDVIDDIRAKEAEIAAIAPDRVASVIVEELRQRPQDIDELSTGVLRRLDAKESADAIANVRGQIQDKIDRGLLTSITAGPNRGKLEIVQRPSTRLFSVGFATDRRDENTADVNFRFGSRRSQLTFGVANFDVTSTELTPLFSRIGEPVIAIRDVSVVPRNRFVSEAKGPDTETADAVLLVPGFNTTFVEALRRAGRLFYTLNLRSVSILFSWPSGGQTFAYQADLENARFSSPDLLGLVDLLPEQGVRKVSAIAEGMGGQVLLDTLRTLQTRGRGYRLDQVILFLPDIDSMIFDRTLRDVSGVAERVTVYVDPNSTPLLVSKLYNGSPRAGVEVGKLATINRVEVVVTSELGPSRLFVGTDLTRPDVVADVAAVLRGVSVEQRVLQKRDDGAWLLK